MGFPMYVTLSNIPTYNLSPVKGLIQKAVSTHPSLIMPTPSSYERGHTFIRAPTLLYVYRLEKVTGLSGPNLNPPWQNQV